MRGCILGTELVKGPRLVDLLRLHGAQDRTSSRSGCCLWECVRRQRGTWARRSPDLAILLVVWILACRLHTMVRLCAPWLFEVEAGHVETKPVKAMRPQLWLQETKVSGRHARLARTESHVLFAGREEVGSRRLERKRRGAQGDIGPE